MLLYNIFESNNAAINEYKDPAIVQNKIILNYDFILRKENLIPITVADSYKFRPERIAYEYYGADEFFPIVLASNKLKSLFEFKPSEMNNTVMLLKSDLVIKILEL